MGLSGLLERLEKAIADLEAQNQGGEDAPVAHLPKELADKESSSDQGVEGLGLGVPQGAHR